MADHFRILGLKKLEPTHNEIKNIHWERVESIQRALFNREGWLFFYGGIRESGGQELLYEITNYDSRLMVHDSWFMVCELMD